MPVKKLLKYINSVNIAEDIDEDELKEIASQAWDGYQVDANSRSDWETQMSEALGMAMQIAEPKNFPWPNAASVKYPLLTIAAIQFWARAYGAIVQGETVVKPQIFGEDTAGEKEKRGRRISLHMNWQILEQMTEWQTDTSKLLISLPIMGCAFKKTFYSPILGRPVSELAHAKSVIVNYEAKDIRRARITHEFELYPNEVKERFNSGAYREIDLHPPAGAGNDDDAPHKFLEQHWFIDLDGDDYKEPYIVTLHKESKEIVRIVARYDAEGVQLKHGDMLTSLALLNKLIADNGGVEPDDMKKVKLSRIEPKHYFTKFTFMPSPDGGFYDMGFGTLLTPINKSVDSTINQMLDAGTLSNLSTGLIGQGLKMRKGPKEITMGEWNQVESGGMDIRQHVYPIQFPGPSQVLFSLLEFLINAGSDIYSVKDIMLGDLPSGDTPATTTLAAIEQGQKLFSGIYKEIHNSQKEEFRKIYNINKQFLSDVEYQTVVDAQEGQRRNDYKGDPTDIAPVSDPSVTSETQRMMKAQALVPFFNDPWNDPREIRKRYYEAIGIKNIDTLLVKEPPQPPPDPKMVKVQGDIEKSRAELMLKMKESPAKVAQFVTQALLNIANAEAAEEGTQINLYQAILKEMEIGQKNATADNEGAVGGLEGAPGNGESI